MAAPWLAQVSIPYESGLPEDVSVNTWSFGGTVADEVAGPVIGNGLAAFYDTIAARMHPALVLNQATVKVYRWDDPKPRTPFFEGTLAIPPEQNNGSPLPEEVAAVLSFEAVQVSGQPQRRRRGRVYLGPLATSATQQIGSHMYLAALFINDVEAGLDAAIALWSAGSVGHGVYSRLDSVLRPAVNYWMDNALDTQRRRGVRATERTVLGP